MDSRWTIPLALMCGGGAAFAQNAPPAPAAAASAPQQRDEAAPQTVTVTAQGRSQQLQNVPIAVQVVTPETLSKLASSNLGDINGYLPGLSVDATEPTQPNFIMRGVGNTDFGIGTDSPVGVYVNGVYAGKTGGALLNYNDVKRIEVLKGPQGTLFGRNSAGGAISIVTNDPGSSFEANGLVRLGNHGTRRTEALVNQPLGEDFALRVSMVSQHSNGWVTDASNGNRAGGDHDWGARASVRWSASDTTTAVLSWEHEQLDQRARPVWPVVTSTPTFNNDPATFVDPRTLPLTNDSPIDKERRLYDGVTLRINHTLSWAEFTSTTAYRHHRTSNVEDNDGTANPASFLATGNFDTNSTWQQEFRLAGKDARADWLAGLSFYREKATQTSQVNTNTNSLDTLLGPQIGVPPFATLSGLGFLAGITDFNMLGLPWQENMNNTGDYRAAALYGDVIWHLGPATNLTTGLRLTRDEKTFTWNNPLRNAAALDAKLAPYTPAFFDSLVTAGALDPASAGLLSQLVQGLQTTNIEFTNPASMNQVLSVKRSWTDVSPRLVLDHHLSADTMVYGSVTRGYQAGGFNAVNTQANGGSFDPERVTNYELGLKGQLPEQGVQYSAALFHYDFTNLQSTTLDQTLAVPAYVVTVSDVKATGLDLEANWRATSGLRLFGAAEIIDQKYKKQRNLAGGAHDLTGQPFGTPRVTAMAGLDYRWMLGNGVADFTLQAAYTGATRCNDDSVISGACLDAPTFKVGEARQRVDTRIGWEPSSHKWGVALIVNNLLDKRYVAWQSNLSAPVGSPYYVNITPPRAWMVEFKASL